MNGQTAQHNHLWHSVGVKSAKAAVHGEKQPTFLRGKGHEASVRQSGNVMLRPRLSLASTQAWGYLKFCVHHTRHPPPGRTPLLSP